MPPKRQNENENQASEATQKKQRNSNKQWATDTNSDGVSAEEHVAVWLSTIPENGRLPNFHNWKLVMRRRIFGRESVYSTLLTMAATVDASFKVLLSK